MTGPRSFLADALAATALFGAPVMAQGDVNGNQNPVIKVAPVAAGLYGRSERFLLDFPGSALQPGCIYEQDFDRYTGTVTGERQPRGIRRSSNAKTLGRSSTPLRAHTPVTSVRRSTSAAAPESAATPPTRGQCAPIRRSSCFRRSPTVSTGPDDEFAWVDFNGRWGERQSGSFNGPTGPQDKARWTHPVDWQDELRSDSVVVPAGDGAGGSIVDTFCGVVERGSGALVTLKTHRCDW